MQVTVNHPTIRLRGFESLLAHKMLKTQNLRTWVEIDRKAIAHNIARLKSFLEPKTKFLAVVKSNAYGHDMVQYAKEAKKSGVDFFGVDSFEEALELRARGIKEPILVLGYVFPSNFAECAKKNISVTISNIESLKTATLPRESSLKIHIKVDTGLHRQGFQAADVEKVFKEIHKAGKKIIIEGLYTHFAAMETPKYESYSRMQIRELQKWRNVFSMVGIHPIVHSSATSGIFFSREFHFDMVRAGISLYGLWPSNEIREVAPKTKLFPLLTWKAIISEVKKVKAGERVGYDLTEKLSRGSVLAVVPIGYFHGVRRSLSSKGEFLVRGKRAKIIGRVSMDMLVIDVTDIAGAKQGDEVVIIGMQGKERVTAEEIAKKTGTINYEVVTQINSAIPRIYK